MKINDTYEETFSYSQEEVNIYAKLTGDDNPIHLDAEYAATTDFGQRIMHGMLGATIFTKVMGTTFPGHGSIYRSQEIKFMRPMYPGVEYRAVFTVAETNPRIHLVKIKTEVFNPDGKATIKGFATLINQEKIV